ncbi:MAG: RsfA family transcriptional regulator [Bacillaceae bacterium]|nr:RsfA family transcriptional regulator [Bacillaceae bacterium]
MGQNRQDAWTEEEDLLLAKTVLNYIREGKTQLEAFEQVARQLSRTKAACGFRWNATVRKQYEKEIQNAKEERRKRDHPTRSNHETITHQSPGNAIDEAIHLLTRMKNNSYHDHSNDKFGNVREIMRENEQLRNRLKQYEQVIQTMEDMLFQVRQTKKQG